MSNNDLKALHFSLVQNFIRVKTFDLPRIPLFFINTDCALALCLFL